MLIHRSSFVKFLPLKACITLYYADRDIDAGKKCLFSLVF